MVKNSTASNFLSVSALIRPQFSGSMGSLVFLRNSSSTLANAGAVGSAVYRQQVTANPFFGPTSFNTSSAVATDGWTNPPLWVTSSNRLGAGSAAGARAAATSRLANMSGSLRGGATPV